ncbi:hypothetical protein C8R46DRAFT_1041159 [Mycena filopes]|nr:hypothetical protein C8R46DRAFT_1041159 [Mycena filopes]
MFTKKKSKKLKRLDNHGRQLGIEGDTVTVTSRDFLCATVDATAKLVVQRTTGFPTLRAVNSNEPPLDAEISLIKLASSRIDARIVVIDEQILVFTVFRRRVEQLTDERHSYIRLRAQNSAIISPLRRIPAEILAEIFAWTLPLVPRLSERERFSSMDSPWFLTHVSHRWRAVAVSTSALWSVVAISYPPHLNPAGLYPLPMLETHVARAQKLKIHFYGHETSDAGPQVEAFNYLAFYASRWSELSLSLTSALVPLLGSLQDRIPSLRRLHIQWSDETSQANVDSIECFHSAPCLVDFAVFNEFRLIPIRLPVQQLTRYQLNGPWELHRDILVRGLNLVEIRLSINFDGEPWPDVEDAVHLPSLRRLYTSHCEVLDFLVAPALEELALLFYLDEGKNIQSSFRPFVERSKCTLRRLCLDGCVDADTVTCLLKDNTYITDLTIIHDDLWNGDIGDVMAMLIIVPGSSEPQIAPQLESISFGSRAGCWVDETLYLEMVHSRSLLPHSILKSIALLSADAFDISTFRTMSETMGKKELNILVKDGEDADEIMNDWTYHPSWN